MLGKAGEDDPALVLFTSGTTSFPKGATLTHGNMLANLQNLLAVARRLPGQDAPDRPASVTLMTMPLFHIGGIDKSPTWSGTRTARRTTPRTPLPSMSSSGTGSSSTERRPAPLLAPERSQRAPSRRRPSSCSSASRMRSAERATSYSLHFKACRLPHPQTLVGRADKPVQRLRQRIGTAGRETSTPSVPSSTSSGCPTIRVSSRTGSSMAIASIATHRTPSAKLGRQKMSADA